MRATRMRRGGLALLVLVVFVSQAWGVSDFLRDGITCGQASKTWSVSLIATQSNVNAAVPNVAHKLPAHIMAHYVRQGGASTQIATAALANAIAAYSAGGWIQYDASMMPGLYRLDLPDAMIACGADWVVLDVMSSYGTATIVNYERIGLASAPDVNVLRWNQTSIAATPVTSNLTQISGAAVSTTTAQLGVNAVNWYGTAITATQPVVNVTRWFGYNPAATNVDVNLVNIAGSAVSTTSAQLGVNLVNWYGTPATATVADVNVEKWFGYNVAATNVDANAKTVSDKTGYSLTQTFPTNFSSFAIDASGRVDVGRWFGYNAAATATTANVTQWNGSTPNNLIAGRVDANTQATAVGLTYDLTGSVSGAVGSVTARVNANTDQWNGTAVIATQVDANAKIVGDKTGYSLTQTFPTNFSSQVISAAGSGIAATYRKNIAAQTPFPVYMRDSTNTALGKPGLTLTVTVSKDSAAFAAATGTAAEVGGAGNGGGWYTFAPSQADTNCGQCIFSVTSAGGVATGYTITTSP